MRKLFLFTLFFGLAAYIYGQEDAKPMKYENSTWYEMVCVNFKPGKMGEAKKIMAKYESAGAAAGIKGPETYWFVTGPYDMMLVWELEGGPSDLEWKYSPESVKWWKAFVKQEGSEEAAEKLQEQYSSFIADGNSQLLRKDN